MKPRFNKMLDLTHPETRATVCKTLLGLNEAAHFHEFKTGESAKDTLEWMTYWLVTGEAPDVE